MAKNTTKLTVPEALCLNSNFNMPAIYQNKSAGFKLSLKVSDQVYDAIMSTARQVWIQNQASVPGYVIDDSKFADAATVRSQYIFPNTANLNQAAANQQYGQIKNISRLAGGAPARTKDNQFETGFMILNVKFPSESVDIQTQYGPQRLDRPASWIKLARKDANGQTVLVNDPSAYLRGFENELKGHVLKLVIDIGFFQGRFDKNTNQWGIAPAVTVKTANLVDLGRVLGGLPDAAADTEAYFNELESVSQTIGGTNLFNVAPVQAPNPTMAQQAPTQPAGYGQPGYPQAPAYPQAPVQAPQVQQQVQAPAYPQQTQAPTYPQQTQAPTYPQPQAPQAPQVQQQVRPAYPQAPTYPQQTQAPQVQQNRPVYPPQVQAPAQTPVQAPTYPQQAQQYQAPQVPAYPQAQQGFPGYGDADVNGGDLPFEVN